MFRRIRWSQCVLLFVIVLVLGLTNGTRPGRSQVTSPPQTSPIDLSGDWELDAGGKIVITHLLATGSVFARFSPALPCHDTERVKLFDSRLKVTPVSGGPPKIALEDGAFEACTRDKKLVDFCLSGKAVWTSKFRDAIVSADGNTITGERFHEWIDYKEEGGRYVNCRVNPAKESWSRFTLTRACAPNKAKQCRAIAKALRLIEKLIPPAGMTSNNVPQPTANFDPVLWNQTLAQNKSALVAELDALRREYCDDPEAKGVIEAQKAILDGLVPGAAQTQSAVIAEKLKVAGIDYELKGLATRTCAVSGPAPPPPHPNICRGVPPKTAEDDRDIDKVIDQLKAAIDEAVATAEDFEREAGGASTTAGQYADYYRTRADQLSKLKGFWENVRAATCVPREVVDLLRSVQGGRTDVCTNLCQKTADWIAKMYPGSQGDIQKEAFFILCSANCPD